MKEYERFCKSLNAMKEIYDYQEAYDKVILTGIVCIYRITFEQSWKMMKEILENYGYEEGATGSPKIILKTAYKDKLKNLSTRLTNQKLKYRKPWMKRRNSLTALCSSILDRSDLEYGKNDGISWRISGSRKAGNPSGA